MRHVTHPYNPTDPPLPECLPVVSHMQHLGRTYVRSVDYWFAVRQIVRLEKECNENKGQADTRSAKKHEAENED